MTRGTTQTERFLSLMAAVLVLASTSIAAAQTKDVRAAKVADRIMNELFSSAKFDDAKASLEGVIGKCGDCAPKTQALLHADLGIVLVTGFSDSKKGKAEFAKARSLDPTLKLDPAFASPEAQAAFQAAGGGAAAGGATTGTGRAVPQDVVLDEEPSAEEKAKKKKRPVPEAEEPEDECARNSDCDRGLLCRAGRCLAPPPPPKAPSVWLSLGVMQDFPILSGDNVCTRNAQVTLGYTCVRSSGSQYHGTPRRGSGDSVSGFSMGPTRLTLGTEFRVADAWSLGIRMGYALFGGAPAPDGGKASSPLHGEAFARYWFSPKALHGDNLAWFVTGAGGVAQLVGKTTTRVTEDPNAPPSTTQIDNPPSQTLDVYRSSGRGFAAAGPGLFLPLGRTTALVADLRLSVFFPTSGFSLGLSAGVAFGL